MSRKFRYGGMATAMSAVVIVVVILINVVAGILTTVSPSLGDLTKDKTFTLSQESIDVAKNVKGESETSRCLRRAVVHFPRAPRATNSIPSCAKFYETTKQYNTQSGGKVVTQYLDLNADPTPGAGLCRL